MNENQSLDPLRNGMGGVRLERLSTNTFYGLNFTNTLDDLVESRRLDATPNILIVGNDILFDYSSVKDPTDIREFRSLFRGKKKNARFTVENANYSETVTGTKANFNGSYDFVKFVGDTKILATPQTGVTYSPDVKVYKSNFFDQVPFIGITLEKVARPAVSMITNNMGINSSESFVGLGLFVNDYIKISAATGGFDKDRLYKIVDVQIETDGTERLIVNRPIEQRDLTGSPVIINSFKTKARIEATGTICLYAKTTLLNTINSSYVEAGTLVECRNGIEEYAKLIADRSDYDYIFIDDKTDGLRESSFNASFCRNCPTSFNSGETIEQQSERIKRGVTSTLRVAPKPTLNFTPKRSQTEPVLDNLITSRETAQGYVRDQLTETIKIEYKGGFVLINGEGSGERAVTIERGKRYVFDTSSKTLSGFRVTLRESVGNTNSKPTGVTVLGDPYFAGKEDSRILYNPSRDTNVIYVDVQKNYGPFDSFGPFAVFGQDIERGLPRGYYYPMYTEPSRAGSYLDNTIQDTNAYHEHNLINYPNITFYMPNSAMNHGRETYPVGHIHLFDQSENVEPIRRFINTFENTSSSSLSFCVNKTTDVRACYRCVMEQNDGSDPCAHAIRLARCYYKYNDGVCDGSSNSKCAPSCAEVLQYCQRVSIGSESNCYYSLNQTSNIRDDDRGISNVY